MQIHPISNTSHWYNYFQFIMQNNEIEMQLKSCIILKITTLGYCLSEASNLNFANNLQLGYLEDETCESPNPLNSRTRQIVLYVAWYVYDVARQHKTHFMLPVCNVPQH